MTAPHGHPFPTDTESAKMQGAKEREPQVRQHLRPTNGLACFTKETAVNQHTQPSPNPTTEPTRVCHVRDNVPGAIYVGRAMPRQRLKGSKWANPWKIGAPASHWGQADPITREGALFAYSTEFWADDGTLHHLLADLHELRGKALACWCHHDGDEITPHNSCHGDLLAHWVNSFTDAELAALAGGKAMHEVIEDREVAA